MLVPGAGAGGAAGVAEDHRGDAEHQRQAGPERRHGDQRGDDRVGQRRAAPAAPRAATAGRRRRRRRRSRRRSGRPSRSPRPSRGRTGWSAWRRRGRRGADAADGARGEGVGLGGGERGGHDEFLSVGGACRVFAGGASGRHAAERIAAVLARRPRPSFPRATPRAPAALPSWHGPARGPHAVRRRGARLRAGRLHHRRADGLGRRAQRGRTARRA